MGGIIPQTPEGPPVRPEKTSKRAGALPSQNDAHTQTNGQQHLAHDLTAQSGPAVEEPGLELSLFRARGPITKKIDVGPDGALKSIHPAPMASGTVERVKVADRAEYADKINHCKSNEALALGALRDDFGQRMRITTKDRLAGITGPVPPDLIARTKGNFIFRPGRPAAVLIDFDSKFITDTAQAGIDACGGVWPALVSAVPALAGVGYVSRASTSSGLRFRNGNAEPISGSSGLHIYPVLTDGSDTPRFLRVLFERCWLAGFGWHLLTANGLLLPRGLIDVSVGDPSRLVFEGNPILSPKLVQDQEARLCRVVEGTRFDSRRDLPDLTAQERAQLEALMAADRKRLEPSAAIRREAYIDARAAEIVARTGLPFTEARRQAVEWCDGKLPLTAVLPFDLKKHAGCAVADVLADPRKFEGATMADPVDPEYGSGKARVFVNPDGRVFVHSFAHGQHIYELKPPIDDPRENTRPPGGEEDYQVNGRDHPPGGDNGHTRAASPPEPDNEDISDNATTARVLNPGSPLKSARALIQSKYTTSEGRTLHHQKDAFYSWCGTHYVETPPEEMRAIVYAFLDTAMRATLSGLVPFDPNTAKVTNVLDALAAEVQLPHSARSPAWLDTARNHRADEIAVCTNGLLHLPTRELMPHTPAFFSLNALDFAYDADAPPPDGWLDFLNSLWDDDPESIDTLQETCGLWITGQTRFQKAFMFIGPRRSGKGTIARVVTHLIGPENVSGPTLSGLGTNFGLAPLIGKRLAVISDARLSGKTNQQPIVERVLAITGEDTLTVDRKYREPWTGRLDVRFLVLSNELPRLADASGAWASRFLLLLMKNSFYGREDIGLTDRLVGELPGILNWALDGLDRLNKRGYFVQPSSAKDALLEMEDLGSPMGAFLREWCDFGPEKNVPVDSLYETWCRWCHEQGRDHAGTKQSFGRDLRASFPRVKIAQTRLEDGGRERYYEGVGFKATRSNQI